MKILRIAVVALLLACKAAFTPTPLLISQLVDQKDQVSQLYMACTTGANYTPDKPGCDSKQLQDKVVSTMSLSKEFISADIKQPHGYVVYLSTAMIYFRIAQRAENDYSEAEMIARQFFEIQKATSTQPSGDARFYWVVMASGHASYQWYNDRLALNADRKADLLLCYAEGNLALVSFPSGPDKVLLVQDLNILKAITDSIK